MSNHNLTPARRDGWVLSAMTAPLVLSAAATPWLVTLALAALCVLAGWGMEKLPVPSQSRKMFWALQYLWTVFALAQVLPQTQSCWHPEENTGILIPVTLILLSACAALPGPDRCGRIGSVLLWLLAGLYGWILLAGLGSACLPKVGTSVQWPESLLLFALLLPCAGTLLPVEGKRRLPWALPAAGLLAVAVSLWTAGILTADEAAGNSDSLYQAVRGLHFFTIAQRFEVFLSAALTLGWFACLSLLLSLARWAADALHPGWGSSGVWAAAGLGLLGCVIGKPVDRVLDLGAVSAWVALPLLAAVADMRKFSGKTKKRG